MLTTYNKKRNFTNTPEPAGKTNKSSAHRFVVQRHDASHLHYDFRLELNGVLKSWAVPKGPSLNASDKRLAVQVEDHPVSYIGFKGDIPKGNYGAGHVDIWDKGNFIPVDEKGKELSDRQASSWLKKGQLKFTLQGKKLKGGFALVQLKNDEKNWLLIKHKDNYAVTKTYNPEKANDATNTTASKKAAPAKKSAAKKPSSSSNKSSSKKIAGHTLEFTNLTKIYWPKDKITKGDLIDYYDKMAPIILPYLKNRPLSLKRNPNGIADKGFYQKDAGEHFPAWIKTAPFESESANKTVHYTICNDKATLLYLANLGCIEMNPWNSTIQSPEKPTYLIMDIDPSPKNTFEQVIETAQVITQILDKAGASYFCKTSGATGLHIFLPLQAKYSYQHARDFGGIIANMTHEQLPDFTSIERSLKKRGPKIYIDYLQNSQRQTVASAYSVRPVDGAQVSAPLLPKELKKGLHPSQFNIFNLEKRVKKLGDLFYMVLKKGNNLQSCLKKLSQ
ncbi:MAG: non-homologous end-joining DNA ligase [Chitinophagaceae bacterium]